MNKVAVNASWIIICKVLKAVFVFFINTLTARFLGPSNYGIITYASSLVLFLVPLMQLGFGDILVKEIIDRPEQEGQTVGTAIVISAFSSCLCIAAVTLFSLAANPEDRETTIVCFLCSLILFFQAFDHIQCWYQAKLLSKYTSIVSLAVYVIVSVFRAYLLIASKSVRWFALASVLDTALISVFLLITYKRVGGQKLSFSADRGRELLSSGKYYVLSGMMVTVFSYTATIMLRHMFDQAADGYYGVALTCSGAFGFIIEAIINSFRPSILERARDSSEVMKQRIRQLFSAVIYLTLIIGIFVTLFAGVLLRLLYGNEYLNAVDPLRILAWCSMFSYIGSVRNIWILASDKQKYLWIINLAGAVSNVALNLTLIPRFGVTGAALSTLATQIIANIIVSYAIGPIRESMELMRESTDPRVLIECIKAVFEKE